MMSVQVLSVTSDTAKWSRPLSASSELLMQVGFCCATDNAVARAHGRLGNQADVAHSRCDEVCILPLGAQNTVLLYASLQKIAAGKQGSAAGSCEVWQCDSCLGGAPSALGGAATQLGGTHAILQQFYTHQVLFQLPMRVSAYR